VCEKCGKPANGLWCDACHTSGAWLLDCRITAEAIADWCFDEWLKSLPKDIIVDRELLSRQFGIDAYTAQCLLNIWNKWGERISSCHCSECEPNPSSRSMLVEEDAKTRKRDSALEPVEMFENVDEGP